MNTVHDERPTDRPPSRLATVSPEPGTGLGAPTPRPLPDTSRRVLVMGIVNRTQDSFFDEGRTWELEQAVSAGLRAAEEGADIVDVGGVKFAPGDPLDPAEEAARVVPVIEQLRRELPGEVLLSVDTFHASVARAALEVGADLINDTTGLSDPRMAEEVARAGASLVLTHSVAEPRRPFPRPRYEDVVEEVRDFLAARLERALEAGIARERIVLDPGPDLNKSTQQTLEVLRDWGEYAALGLPLLAALSRKDFVGESLGLPKEERLAGSLAAAAWTIRLGARILRVHDVRETVRMVRMLEVLAGWREPAGPLVHNV
ncbi:dihydropteroate synthase [Brachybacterium paraconglomeratum]|uniref:Dihydropteroate synthase n=1 Tax=Brachybacterium paraconglomeratum TaxID=173362 RepID=A0A921GP81_9MICO|nr:dihydropteroate synthase [Brachybacterium paraconglomeratum]HJF49759.1 dihydropteroate synthase [Brachybacterium paraconglomeratum]